MMMMNMGGGSMGSGSMGMDMMNMGMNMGSNMGSMNMGAAPQMGQMAHNMQGMPYQGYMGGAGHIPGQMAVDYGAHGAAGAHGASAVQGVGIFGTDFTTLLTGIFNFAISIFAILLVVGLIVGVVVFLKRYLVDGAGFGTVANSACAKCGNTLKAEWNCCPKCGEIKGQAFIATPQQQNA